MKALCLGVWVILVAGAAAAQISLTPRTIRVDEFTCGGLLSRSGEQRDRVLIYFNGYLDLLDLRWIAHHGRVFRLAGICERSRRERYETVLGRVATSVRPLRPVDQERLLETRLRVRPARGAETVAEVLARNNSTWSPASAAAANGMAVATRLEAGWPVKVAIRERPGPGQ